MAPCQLLARRRGFEPLTPRFVVWCSMPPRVGSHADWLAAGGHQIWIGGKVNSRWLQTPATTLTEQTIFSFPPDEPALPKARRIAFLLPWMRSSGRSVFAAGDEDAGVFDRLFNILPGRTKQVWANDVSSTPTSGQPLRRAYVSAKCQQRTPALFDLLGKDGSAARFSLDRA